MNEKIEQLAFEKDFSDLTAEERNLVLADMPEEAFKQLRSVLQAARQMDAGVLPPPRLKAQLLERMSAKPKPGLPGNALTARIPMWSVAATLFLGIAAGWLLKPTSVQEKIVSTIELRTDTVWQEKTVWRERVVWRERIVYPKKTADEPIAFLPEKIDSQELEIEFTQPEFASPRVGTSLGDAPELMLFFTQGDK